MGTIVNSGADPALASGGGHMLRTGSYRVYDVISNEYFFMSIKNMYTLYIHYYKDPTGRHHWDGMLAEVAAMLWRFVVCKI